MSYGRRRKGLRSVSRIKCEGRRASGAWLRSTVARSAGCILYAVRHVIKSTCQQHLSSKAQRWCASCIFYPSPYNYSPSSMPPRKSLSRASARAESSTAGFSKSAQPQPHAGPSRPLKRLPPLSMPESVTPAFKRQRTEGRELDDEERGILIHEVSLHRVLRLKERQERR